MLKRCLILILTGVLTASCVTDGNYCDLSSIIRPSRTDGLTSETKKQILEHNLTYEKFCK